MKRTVVILVIILLGITGSGYFILNNIHSYTSSTKISLQTSITPTPTPTPINQSLLLGVYDPQSSLDGDKRISAEEIFLPWRLHDTSALSDTLNKVFGKERSVLVTIEPWPFNINGLTATTLYPDIANGKYDSTITDICRVFSVYKDQTILLRWAHEMDNYQGPGQFPWSQNDPKDFILAYRHVVSTCRNIATNVKYIWSPIGTPTSVSYWPGTSYVDYIGLSIFEYVAYDTSHRNPIKSFTDIVNRKVALYKSFNTSFIICEFGITGDTQSQQTWIHTGLTALPSVGDIRMAFYFNAKDRANSWGVNYPVPDWRIQFML